MTLPHLTDKEAEEAQNHLVYSTIELNLRSSDFLSIATSTTLCYLTFEKYFENQISTEKKEVKKISCPQDTIRVNTHIAFLMC